MWEEVSIASVYQQYQPAAMKGPCQNKDIGITYLNSNTVMVLYNLLDGVFAVSSRQLYPSMYKLTSTARTMSNRITRAISLVLYNEISLTRTQL